MFLLRALKVADYTNSLKKVGIVLAAIGITCLLCADRASGQDALGPSRLIPARVGPTKMSERPLANVRYSKRGTVTTDKIVGPSTAYVATAYSLRGRTASGHPVGRGVIAADPKHLPLGSRVRLEAGLYSGEYLVADSGFNLHGKKIEIWTPTSDEAAKFGDRDVKLTVLSGPDHSPIKIVEDLEKEYAAKRITDAEYQTRYAEWLKLAAQAVAADVQYYVKHPKLYESATCMPAKSGPVDSNEKTLLDTQHERFRLEMDFARKVISQTEYAERLAAIINEEKAIARRATLSGTDMVRYYETTEKIQPLITLFKNAFEESKSGSIELLIKLATIFVTMFGIALPFYLGKKKDIREKKLLEFEMRRLELAEVSSQETIVKTKLLLETKQYQVKEMMLRIAQLEKQLGNASNKLLIS